MAFEVGFAATTVEARQLFEDHASRRRVEVEPVRELPDQHDVPRSAFFRLVDTFGAISAFSTFLHPQSGQSTSLRLTCLSKSSLERNQPANS